jgi:hypothetical protein
MGMIDRMERRFGWLGFPGFLRYYALLHVLVFAISLFRPDLTQLLDFDRAKILSGEYWRIVTCFFADQPFGRPGLLSILLLFFALNFAFMINDGLESEWGPFKASLFCYFGMAMVLLANFVLPQTPPFSGFTLYASAFLAFATLHPRVEVLLFLILPLRVGILGIVQGAFMLFGAVTAPMLIPFYLLAFLNYALWAGIPALRGKLRTVQSAQRRQAFRAASVQSEEEAFHSCVLCDRTEVSHPELEFRVGADGREYCSDHLRG